MKLAIAEVQLHSPVLEAMSTGWLKFYFRNATAQREAAILELSKRGECPVDLSVLIVSRLEDAILEEKEDEKETPG